MKVRFPYQSSHSTKKGGKSRTTTGERMKSIDSMKRISNAHQESKHLNVPSIPMLHSSSKGNENTTRLSITSQITTETNAFLMEVKRGKNRKHSRKNKQQHSFGSQTAPSNASVSNKSKRDLEVVEDSHTVNVDDIPNSRLNTLDVNRLDVPFLNKESSETITPNVPFLNEHSHSGHFIDSNGAVLAVGSSIRERKENESFETQYPSLFHIDSNDDGHNDVNSCIYYHYYTNDNEPQGILSTSQAEQEGGYPTPEQLAMTQPYYWNYIEHPFMINHEYPLPCHQEYHGVYFAPHGDISTTSTSTTTTTAIEPAHSIVGYEQVNIGGCIYFHPVFE